MTLAGWLFALAAWGAIIGTTVFCFWRLLGKKEPS